MELSSRSDGVAGTTGQVSGFILINPELNRIQIGGPPIRIQAKSFAASANRISNRRKTQVSGFILINPDLSDDSGFVLASPELNRIQIGSSPIRIQAKSFVANANRILNRRKTGFFCNQPRLRALPRRQGGDAGKRKAPAVKAAAT
jgi:hypothetical protein